MNKFWPIIGPGILCWLAIANVTSGAPNLEVNSGTADNPVSITGGTYNVMRIGCTAVGYGLLTNATATCTNDAAGYGSTGYIGDRRLGSLVISNNGVLNTAGYMDWIGWDTGGHGIVRITGNGRWSSYRPEVGGAHTGFGELTVESAGALVCVSLCVGGTRTGADSSLGYLYLKDNGSITVSNVFYMGHNSYTPPSTGFVYQTGGTLRHLGVSGSSYIGINDNAVHEFHISGGSFASENGIWDIGGYVHGSASTNGTGLGLLHVDGAGATNISFAGAWTLQSNGTLRCSVTTGGVTKIVNTDSVTLKGTLDMEITSEAGLALCGLPLSDASRVFELIQGSSLTTNSTPPLRLTPGDETLWQIGTNGTVNTLTATYIRFIPKGTIFYGR